MFDILEQQVSLVTCPWSLANDKGQMTNDKEYIMTTNNKPWPHKRLALLLTLLLACSPYFARPVDDLYVTLGEHFGGLIISGDFQEFCVLLDAVITDEHIPWWNPLAVCTEDLMTAAFDDDLEALTPGGIIDLDSGYSSWDGMDEYFQMLAGDYGLVLTNAIPITPGLSLYDQLNLPGTPFYWADETVTDQYQVFAYAGPTDTHLWGAYCLDFTNVGSRTVISDIRLGCCYDGFTDCSAAACDRCPGGPPPADYCDTPGDLVQEAEDGGLNGAFERFADGDAGGDEAIEVNADVSSGTGSNHHADFCFDVSEAGAYRIRAGIRADNGDENSFYVTVNGSPGDGYLWDLPTAAGVWQTDYISDRNDGGDTVEITLQAGSNSVRVYHRERNTKLDWIELELQ